MKEEIVSGIKNAMQRGSSYEGAVQSFINAGYSEEEVKEAGKMLSGGVSEIINGEFPEAPVLNDNSLPALPLARKKSKLLIVVIIIVGLIVIGIMGYLAYYLTRS